MPLLCISLFALLLLPQSLCCDSKNPVTKVKKDYRLIVKVDLDNARDDIWALLQLVTCPEMKTQPENCTSSSDELITLSNLVCKLETFGLNQTRRLIQSVAASVGCFCNRPTARPGASATTTRTARLRKAHHDRRTKNREKRENRRLCKAEAILSSIRECYEILNTRLSPSTS